MNRNIKKVAVLGSGVMGSRIACHFANIGVEVLLLDIVPKELLPEEQAKGLTLSNALVRNRIVNHSLETAIKSNPAPLYSKSFASRISTGNFDDDMDKIRQADWVIEVVVERLEIKKSVFDQVEKHRKAGTLITSNTSGIPIHLMTQGRSDDFKAHFCGTHFFNPPRYLELLEIIPGVSTNKDVVDFLVLFGDKLLGKTVVKCKDTPAFIGNRIGVYSMLALTHLIKPLGLSVEEVDKYTGPAMGHPKSATFRTADVVGLDTLVNVAKGLVDNAPEDEAKGVFQLPDFITQMVENKWLGEKSKKGFYQKIKDAQGNSEILSLDLQTMDYAKQQKVKSSTLEATKGVEDIRKRMKVYEQGTDKAAELFRAMHYPLFEYVSKRVPEITDDFYRIDDAMRAGFGWEIGPFEVWDALGVRETLAKIQAEQKRLAGHTGEVAAWVQEMLEAGCESFYKVENGQRFYYDIATKTYQAIPGTEDFIALDLIRKEHTIWENTGVSIIDLGDGIINCEFHTKMNTIGADVIAGLNKAIDLAEKEYRGLVISNDGKNFSAGANIGMIFMLAVEQDYEELDMAVRMFQNTAMRLRYSSIPVVAAPFQLTLGGGCEFSMHADFVQLHAETYMGLVEFGVGVIPGGGGSKEFALRASDEYKSDQIVQNYFKERFLTIGQAKVSTSAYEAYELGYLQAGKFGITMNRKRLIADAFIQASYAQGINNPVGMCYQDAGWDNGPWLGTGSQIQNKSIYVTWKEYIEEISSKNTGDNWHFSQENVLVNLMWGSQVLQRIAQQVRTSENKIIQTEKINAMANLEHQYRPSTLHMDEAWRQLMMAQHHDSWIVPYNKLDKDQTWAQAIANWTNDADSLTQRVLHGAIATYRKENKSKSGNLGSIRVYNTMGIPRSEPVAVKLPPAIGKYDITIFDADNQPLGSQLEKRSDGEYLYFTAKVPSFGYATFEVRQGSLSKPNAAGVHFDTQGNCLIENDMYKIIIDPAKGGVIKSLVAKHADNKEFVDLKGTYSLGEIAGHFFHDNQFHSSKGSVATITVLQDHAFLIKVLVEGKIANHPFKQIISLEKGQKRIDFNLTIDWQDPLQIGKIGRAHV